jgi:hypothetical protein
MSPSSLGEDNHRNYENKRYPDLKYFRRIRVCDECGNEFETAEMALCHVAELEELRASVAEFKGFLGVAEGELRAALRAIEKLDSRLGRLSR